MNALARLCVCRLKQRLVFHRLYYYSLSRLLFLNHATPQNRTDLAGQTICAAPKSFTPVTDEKEVFSLDVTFEEAKQAV